MNHHRSTEALAIVLALALAGCSGAAFSMGDLPLDAGDAGARGDAGAEHDAAGDELLEADHDAEHHDAQLEDVVVGIDAPPPACTCSGSSFCSYAQSEPAPGAGAPQPVHVVHLSPSAPTADATLSIVASPAPAHNVTWLDLDVSAFTSGGQVIVSGKLGAPGCDGSSYLVPQCAAFPASGGQIPVVENASSIPAGSAWSFSAYAFAAGTSVLHVGSEGAWDSAAGTTNVNVVSVAVQ